MTARIDGEISGGRKKHRARGFDLVAMLIRPQERLLHNIFGSLARTDQASDVAAQGAMALRKKPPPSVMARIGHAPYRTRVSESAATLSDRLGAFADSNVTDRHSVGSLSRTARKMLRLECLPTD